MTMTMISVLITDALGAGGWSGAKKGSKMRNKWRSSSLLALGGPQLISTSLCLFILVIVLRPTYLLPLWQKLILGITTKFLSVLLKARFLPNRAGRGGSENVSVSFAARV